jgi:hypothetical protein
MLDLLFDGEEKLQVAVLVIHRRHRSTGEEMACQSAQPQL